jgi:predicted ferric reductase
VQARRLRFVPREAGPATIVALAAGLGVLWTGARPAAEPTTRYVGQLLGAESVLLLSIGLVLISTLPWVEQWFDGIDRAAIWHRRVAITGLALLAPHVLLSSNPDSTRLGGPLGAIGVVGLVTLVLWAILPRWQSVVPAALRGLVLAARDAPGIRSVRKVFGGYDRWRALHRTTGLFVGAGFVHGVLDGTPFPDSPALRWSYLAIGAVGLGFYVYRELLARFFLSLHDYHVTAVQQIEPGLVEVSLQPIGRAVDFVPGQFAMVHLEAKDGWHRHPFTISSAPHERTIRFTVKALGDYTSSLPQLIEPGMPAVIGGPHGRFSHWRGTDRQVWIAGGVGVAPFLSWLRSLDHDLPHRVDFFYSSVGDAPFADEIRAIAERHEQVTAHVIDTSIDGRLTPARVLAVTEGRPQDLTVFMCGPEQMVRDFQRASVWLVSRRVASIASTSTGADDAEVVVVTPRRSPGRAPGPRACRRPPRRRCPAFGSRRRGHRS